MQNLVQIESVSFATFLLPHTTACRQVEDNICVGSGGLEGTCTKYRAKFQFFWVILTKILGKTSLFGNFVNISGENKNFWSFFLNQTVGAIYFLGNILLPSKPCWFPMAMFLKKHVFSPLFLDKTKHTFLWKLLRTKALRHISAEEVKT